MGEYKTRPRLATQIEGLWRRLRIGRAYCLVQKNLSGYHPLSWGAPSPCPIRKDRESTFFLAAAGEKNGTWSAISNPGLPWTQTSHAVGRLAYNTSGSQLPRKCVPCEGAQSQRGCHDLPILNAVYMCVSIAVNPSLMLILFFFVLVETVEHRRDGRIRRRALSYVCRTDAVGVLHGIEANIVSSGPYISWQLDINSLQSLQNFRIFSLRFSRPEHYILRQNGKICTSGCKGSLR